MTHPELAYQLALTVVPQVGDAQARILLQQLGSASAIFKAKKDELEKIEGMGSVRAKAIKSFNDFHIVETEMRFIEKNRISTLLVNDPLYPRRLSHCADAPTLLFYKGSANLDAGKAVAIVGTRSCTEYGKSFTEKLVADLAQHEVLVVSGLALGIDAAAHKTALKNGLATVGVVGHGLDNIYPSGHRSLARDMIENGGGLLSEFFSGTRPDRFHFPLRNRIVAGLTDCTIVIETTVNGGSMITAKLADGYNRDVFALPGRTTDFKSAGCNFLLQHQKAAMITSAADLLQVMGWDTTRPAVKPQRSLFIELSEDEKAVLNILGDAESKTIDAINALATISSSAVAAALLNLEIHGLVKCLPGKRFAQMG